MPLVNRTQLENASVDCGTIETAANGPANLNGNGSFYSRLGIQLRTFASIIARFGTEFEAARDDAYNQIITGSAALTTAENKSLLVTLSGLVNAQTVILKGYYTAMDGGDQLLVYRSTGKTGITVDNGFYFDAIGGDDYFEAIDKSVANVKKFGAKGDGTTNDTARLQAAANAAATLKVPMYIPFGTYITSEISLTGKTGFKAYGEGTLKALTPRWLGGIFRLTTCSNCHFEGLTFDTNQPNMVAYVLGDYANKYCVGIFLETSCNEITVERCQFINLYNHHIWSNITNNLRVRHCQFISPAQNQEYRIDFILHGTGTGDLDISDNIFNVTSVTSKSANAAALLLSGHTGKTTICNNTFYRCGRDNNGTHRVGAIDFYASMDGGLVQGNRSFDTQHNFFRATSCRNIIVTDNYADTSNPSFNDLGFVQVSATTGLLATKHITIKNNTFKALVTSTTGYCFNISSLKWEDHLDDVTIENNHASGFYWGMNLVGSYENLRILNNELFCENLGIVWGNAGVTGTEASGKTINLTVSGNHVVAKALGISIALPNTFAGTRGGRNLFSENHVTSVHAAIGMNNVNHEYRNNRISGTPSVGLYPRGAITYYRSGNVIDAGVVTKIIDGGTTVGGSGTTDGTGTITTPGSGDVF